MKKNILLLLILLGFSDTSYSQELPYRIGITVGTPNLIGLDIEYVTPALNEKLAPTLDFSLINIEDGSDVDISFSYLEFGANYYFGKKSKGFYGHLSYGRIGFTGNYNDPDYGSGEGKLSLSSVNFKVGAKWGNRLYLRPEIGFASFIGDPIVRVTYNNPSSNSTIIVQEKIPNYIDGDLVFNLGLGLAF